LIYPTGYCPAAYEGDLCAFGNVDVLAAHDGGNRIVFFPAAALLLFSAMAINFSYPTIRPAKAGDQNGRRLRN
jgi:hypothetical protein